MKNKLDTEQISKEVDSWIAEEDLPVGPFLKIDRPRLFKSEEEYIQWSGFIAGYLAREHELLELIPKPVYESDFYVQDDFLESAFNTHDFERFRKARPFDKYHWKLKMIYERVKDLADLHSAISHQEGKKNTYKRYKLLIEREFRDQAVMLIESYEKYPHLVGKVKCFERVAKLNAQIRKCNRIWKEYAYRA